MPRGILPSKLAMIMTGTEAMEMEEMRTSSSIAPLRMGIAITARLILAAEFKW